MNISFDGINESIVTFKTDTNIEPGKLVSVVCNDTVKQSTVNNSFIGVCISCKNNLAAIQIGGFATIKMNTVESLEYGRNFFVSDDDASLKLAENTNSAAIPLNVVSIDKDTYTIGVFLI